MTTTRYRATPLARAVVPLAVVALAIVVTLAAMLTASRVDAAPSTSSTTPRTATTWAPCASEDAPGPCVWDARHRGNGRGESFLRHADATSTRITHRHAHRLTH